jgi:hypothetical protein
MFKIKPITKNDFNDLYMIVRKHLHEQGLIEVDFDPTHFNNYMKSAYLRHKSIGLYHNDNLIGALLYDLTVNYYNTKKLCIIQLLQIDNTDNLRSSDTYQLLLNELYQICETENVTKIICQGEDILLDRNLKLNLLIKNQWQEKEPMWSKLI